MDENIITIRQLIPEDLDEMVKVEEETWEPDLRASREAMEERFTRFPKGALGAYVDGELTGMTYAHRIGLVRKTWEGNSCKEAFDPSGKFMYLVNVGVSSKHSGRGIGSRLLDKNKELARELGCERIYLGARGTEENSHFYQKNGFTIYETVHDFWPEDKASNGVGHLMEFILKG